MQLDVYTTLEPFLTPILQQSTTALQEGSAAVIDTADQYEVSQPCLTGFVCVLRA